jgi:hypothetical protein
MTVEIKGAHYLRKYVFSWSKRLLKAKITSREPKIFLHNTLKRPVVIHALETFVSTRKTEGLCCFQTGIFRCILGQ